MGRSSRNQDPFRTSKGGPAVSPTKVTVIAYRCSLAIALAFCLFAPAGQVQTAAQTSAPAIPSKKHPPASTAAAPPTAVVPSSSTTPKPAAPPSTAPTGLVRKSAAYWSQYKSDIISQVFDGGFGEDVDEDGQFHALFTGYVEQFSDSCRAYVPSPFEKETITHTVDGQPVSSKEIFIDMRFWPKYHEFTNLGGFSTKSVNTAIGVVTGRTSLSTYLDPAFDIIKFFRIESCKSAAMRQLTENILRAATGKPSLQTVGASIPGAAAESDKSPGPRFAHFADGCNAFFRDPKNARFAPSDPTGYCQCLSDGYQGVMTPAEDLLYANNFEAKFQGGIAQPWGYGLSKSDPAWARLNPVAVSCMQ
jgi:hypothetical protein